MGVVARYIDALSDEQRDRIIEAGRFCDGFGRYFDPQSTDLCGCLVGVAEHEAFATDSPLVEESEFRNGWYPSDRFPVLCARFGKDRIVRLCKARAAKGNQPTPREVMDFRERAAGVTP